MQQETAERLRHAGIPQRRRYAQSQPTKLSILSLFLQKKENDNVSLSWPFVPSLCITSHARAMGAYIYFFIICLEVTMAIY